jgi:small subunit ribosomal protein S3
MGQKVHPGGLRVGIIHDWKSNWCSDREFSRCLGEDIRIREHINRKLSHAGLSDIHIRKDSQKITIDIYTARPGIVIGKSGVEVDALRKEVHAITGRAVQININEIKRPELDARLMAQSVAEQLQNRVAFRRAMKRSMQSAVRSGAQGVRIKCGGRLGGGEMSRTEQYSEGRVPLQTLRADIDYGFAEAKTTYGRIGVKVWINKGEIMPEGYESDDQGATRLGEVDARRRKGGAKGAIEELGPARPARRRGGPGGDRAGGGERGDRPEGGRRPRGGPGGPGGPNQPRLSGPSAPAGRRARLRPETPPAEEAVAEETVVEEVLAAPAAEAPAAVVEEAVVETAVQETSAEEPAAEEAPAAEAEAEADESAAEAEEGES